MELGALPAAQHDIRISTESPMSNRNHIAALAASIAAAAVLGFAGGRTDPITSLRAETTVAPAPTPAATRTLPDFTVLVEQNGAAVVNISTTARVRTQAQQFQLDPDDPLSEFF